MESWIRKSELSRPDELFGEGRGFNIGYTCPKLFTVGKREDLLQELRAYDDQSFTLYLYQLDIGKSYSLKIERDHEDDYSSVKLQKNFDSVQLTFKRPGFEEEQP